MLAELEKRTGRFHPGSRQSLAPTSFNQAASCCGSASFWKIRTGKSWDGQRRCRCPPSLFNRSIPIPLILLTSAKGRISAGPGGFFLRSPTSGSHLTLRAQKPQKTMTPTPHGACPKSR